MKCFCIILALIAVCAADAPKEEINVEALVADEAAMKQFVDCFTGKAECITEAATAKNEFPEVLADACANCTPAQKHTAKVFFGTFKKNYSADYAVVRKNFDTENKLFPAFEAAISSS